MKGLIVRKYLVHMIVYTVLYFGIVILFDFILDGYFVDWLASIFPISLIRFFWSGKRVIVYTLYMIGFIVVTVLHVCRFARLLNTVSQALNNESVLFSRKKVPAELREFSQKLREFKQLVQMNEEARRLAEQQKSDLIVYLAHDLKTPLTSVIGYLSLLDEAPDIPMEQRTKYTGIALEKAYRLEHLINEFFEITRLNLQPSSLPKVPFNLTVLLLQVVNEFYPMLESKGMDVRTNIAPELLLNGDPDKLARVFENLLRNAVNYGWENTQISCTAYIDGQNAVIRIGNTGNTLSPEKLGHIFDKFYRLDDARQSATGGTGLGLAIAKQIVELHGGTITVTSISGVTEFTVILPM